MLALKNSASRHMTMTRLSGEMLLCDLQIQANSTSFEGFKDDFFTLPNEAYVPVMYLKSTGASQKISGIFSEHMYKLITGLESSRSFVSGLSGGSQT